MDKPDQDKVIVEQVELLPCPFCGAEQAAKTGGPKLMVSDSGRGWTVRCTACLARGENRFVAADAVNAWNTRIEATRPRSSSEGVEEMAEALANAVSLLEEATGLLGRLEPHLDAIVCYASTMDEHEPNRLAVDTRAFLAKLNPSDRQAGG